MPIRILSCHFTNLVRFLYDFIATVDCQYSAYHLLSRVFDHLFFLFPFWCFQVLCDKHPPYAALFKEKQHSLTGGSSIF